MRAKDIQGVDTQLEEFIYLFIYCEPRTDDKNLWDSNVAYNQKNVSFQLKKSFDNIFLFEQ